LSNISASVLARLKNISEKKISISTSFCCAIFKKDSLHALQFQNIPKILVLKGGFLLLAYNIEKARPTKDIDFLGVNIPNERKAIEQIVREIAVTKLDDGVDFLTGAINAKRSGPARWLLNAVNCENEVPLAIRTFGHIS